MGKGDVRFGIALTTAKFFLVGNVRNPIERVYKYCTHVTEYCRHWRQDRTEESERVLGVGCLEEPHRIAGKPRGRGVRRGLVAKREAKKQKSAAHRELTIMQPRTWERLCSCRSFISPYIATSVPEGNFEGCPSNRLLRTEMPNSLAKCVEFLETIFQALDWPDNNRNWMLARR